MPRHLVRPANSQDLPAVQRLALALVQQESTAVADIPSGRIFVAELAGAIVGMAIVDHEKLSHVYVSGGYRLGGIGRALVRAVVDHIGTGFELELVVSSQNLGAHAFYKRLGFQQADGLAWKYRTEN